MHIRKPVMFRIKKLDIFIIKQFSLLFVGTFFISLFVLMMQFVWKYIDMLIGKGLSMEVLAQFFGYMSLMMVPQALPLALLLSSLITFGNLGESSELTAIKASGISLMQAMRPLIVFSILTSLVSLYFQNNIGPASNMKMAQLMLSMKQKSPELEIPEGIFYDGIPNSNIYVQRKNLSTGMLYGIMIYQIPGTGRLDDSEIILADSGQLQSTAEKKHLLLNLYSGKWFRNLKAQDVTGNAAAIPYSRETFWAKRIVIDFDGDFNMTDASVFSNDARGKSLQRIYNDIDSLKQEYDSIGRMYMKDARRMYYTLPKASKVDSAAAAKRVAQKKIHIDSIYAQLKPGQRRTVINAALSHVQSELNDLEFKSLITSDGDKLIRQHEIEAARKFTLALQCLIFFFIGAPLGAIIRKGGLGVPVIISVLVFIIYFILDNSGYRMARGGFWTVAFGTSLAPVLLTPLAIFVTYKANNDSVVFNIDLYKDMLMRMLGLRLKRHVSGKEVIINDPDYHSDAQTLARISKETDLYAQKHHLRSAPNWIKVFFKYEPDHEIERINEEMETTIEDLSNTRDRKILGLLSHYPILSTKAHTRPFERKWLNITSAIIIPLGIFFYCRMWRYRLRLWRDLRTIRQTNEQLLTQIEEMDGIGKKRISQP